MIITNSFSNFISHLNNSHIINKSIIIQPKSKKVIYFLDLLLEEGLIKTYRYTKDSKFILIYLIKQNNCLFNKFIQISKKKKHNYIKYKDLLDLKDNYILSTTKGFLTKKKAIQAKLGGILLIKICIN